MTPYIGGMQTMPMPQAADDVAAIESAMAALWADAGRLAALSTRPAQWDEAVEEAMAVAGSRVDQPRSHGGSA